MSEGPDTTTTDTAPEQGSMESLFESAIAGMGNPEEGAAGHPEQTEAVGTSEAADTKPEQATEKVEETPEAETDEAKVEQTVNFDGFSDDQKATWERLLKAGHVTREEIESHRLAALRHADYTRKTMALADQRKAWEAEQAKLKDDMDLLARIRSDDKWHEAWLKLSKDGVRDDDDADSDDLADKRTAREIARQEFERLQAEREKADHAKRAERASKEAALGTALREAMASLSITPEQAVAYIREEEAALPPNVDPYLYFKPEDVHYRLALRHEAAKAKAELAALKEQLTQRASRDARAAKASSPPARSVPAPHSDDPKRQTETDLGLDPDWSNVAGIGLPGR